jgi:hypothetical protein
LYFETVNAVARSFSTAEKGGLETSDTRLVKNTGEINLVGYRDCILKQLTQ